MKDSEALFGVYVHIPWCRSKCLYCDFYSEARRPDWSRYVDALLAECRLRSASVLGKLADGHAPYTLYIGGGTPSMMPDDECSRLSRGLRSILGCEPKEFTIEVNPDDVSDAKALAWLEAGVNRVSMGVQSLVDKELRAVGRRHSADTARDAFAILRPHFSNISLDVIFGLPHQTLDSLGHTVEGRLEMRPEHLSAYSLMYEEGTALTRLRDAARLQEADEGLSVEMFRMLSGMLRDAGYEQYEISNYSLPGYRSRHNSLYWAGKPYLGLGAGAHSYDGLRTRTFALSDARAYMNGLLDPSSISSGKEIWTSEHLDDNELREEMIMTRLRTREGLPLGEYEARFGNSELDALLRRAVPFIKNGSLLCGDSGIRLSSAGIMTSDEIFSSLF